MVLRYKTGTSRRQPILRKPKLGYVVIGNNYLKLSSVIPTNELKSIVYKENPVLPKYDIM